MTGFDADGINAEFFGDGRCIVLAVVNIGEPSEGAWYGRAPGWTMRMRPARCD